jgi:hypothetical protein
MHKIWWTKLVIGPSEGYLLHDYVVDFILLRKNHKKTAGFCENQKNWFRLVFSVRRKPVAWIKKLKFDKF